MAAPTEMSGALRVRLRTQNGDLGPVDAAGSDTVGELKSKLLSDWSRLTAGKSDIPAPFIEQRASFDVHCLRLRVYDAGAWSTHI